MGEREDRRFSEERHTSAHWEVHLASSLLPKQFRPIRWLQDLCPFMGMRPTRSNVIPAVGVAICV